MSGLQRTSVCLSSVVARCPVRSARLIISETVRACDYPGVNYTCVFKKARITRLAAVRFSNLANLDRTWGSGRRFGLSSKPEPQAKFMFSSRMGPEPWVPNLDLASTLYQITGKTTNREFITPVTMAPRAERDKADASLIVSTSRISQPSKRLQGHDYPESIVDPKNANPGTRKGEQVIDNIVLKYTYSLTFV